MDRRSFLQAGVGAAMAAASAAAQTSPAQSPPANIPVTSPPRITGSFFDIIHVNWWDAQYWTDTCVFWREEQWRALIRGMHEIGIDTAICGSTAFWGRPLFPGYEAKVGRPAKLACPHALAACVDEAERLGMKLFFGFGFRGRCSQVRDYAGMEPPWPDVWFRWNTAVAEALVEQFGARSSFAGLYISYEMDFLDHQIDLYEKLVKEYLRPAIGAVPLLASPGNLGDHPNLDKLPEQLERAGITILAPQDYGGRPGIVSEALALVRKNAEALERARTLIRSTGVQLWANCEVFNLDGTPDGRAACVPGPIERIAQQIAIQAPLVEKLICYQFQGIMNPHTELLNIGHPDTDRLHRDYMAYLQGSG